jgi:8-oxo-dGTP pyrophosphatase MutT (NUDIX family)
MATKTTGPDLPAFGTRIRGVTYGERPAAYAVIRNSAGAVAAVRGATGYWLPGGAALPGETPEVTVAREVREELGRALRLGGRVGEAVQYFFAAAEGRYYVMRAVFFRAELAEGASGPGEGEICWLDARQAEALFFHECHAWAARQERQLASDGSG